MTAADDAAMGAAGEGGAAPPAQGTRERLLDLAAQVFADEGYAAASVRDLAKRSNVTSGAIYGNFAGKADLLVAAIAAQVRLQMEVVPPPGVERLDEVLADVFHRYPERRALRALLLEGAVAGRSDPSVQARLREEQEGRLESWTAAYADFQQRGDLATELSADAVVRLLWAIELGLGVLEALGVEPPTPAEAAAIVARMTRGLGPDGDSSSAIPTP